MITLSIILGIIGLGSVYWGLAYRKKKIINQRLKKRLDENLGKDIFRANEIYWLRCNDILSGKPLTEETENAIRKLKKDSSEP